jgi:hypothetical protein
MASCFANRTACSFISPTCPFDLRGLDSFQSWRPALINKVIGGMLITERDVQARLPRLDNQVLNVRQDWIPEIFI